MIILIAADMEGISGKVDREQVTPGRHEYLTRGRQLMPGRCAAQCLSLPEARVRICAAAARAVLRLREQRAAPAYRVKPPVRLVVEFLPAQPVDRAFLLPGAVRADGTRPEYTAPDMVTAQRAPRAMVAPARD